MPKKETAGAPEVPEGRLEAQPPQVTQSLQAQMQADQKALEHTEELLAKKRAQLEESRRLFEIEYARKMAKREAEESQQRKIPVVVQRRRNAPVKILHGGKTLVLESMKVTLVSKRELRVLQGLRNRGVIDLVIGDIGKDGKIAEKKVPAVPK